MDGDEVNTEPEAYPMSNTKMIGFCKCGHDYESHTFQGWLPCSKCNCEAFILDKELEVVSPPAPELGKVTEEWEVNTDEQRANYLEEHPLIISAPGIPRQPDPPGVAEHLREMVTAYEEAKIDRDYWRTKSLQLESLQSRYDALEEKHIQIVKELHVLLEEASEMLNTANGCNCDWEETGHDIPHAELGSVLEVKKTSECDWHKKLAAVEQALKWAGK